MLEHASSLPVERATSAFYMRLSVQDRPGAVATIAARMAERGISFESIVQRRPSHRSAPVEATVPVVLVTYDTVEAHLKEALAAIAADGCIAEPPQVIRIDRRR
jgi:homoserine dehydrogenase